MWFYLLLTLCVLTVVGIVIGSVISDKLRYLRNDAASWKRSCEVEKEQSSRDRKEHEKLLLRYCEYRDWFTAQGLSPDNIWDKKPKAIPPKTTAQPAATTSKAKGKK